MGFSCPTIASTFSDLGLDDCEEFDSLRQAQFKDSQLMDFARVNYGCLGIVTEFWIRANPQFIVEAVDRILNI